MCIEGHLLCVIGQEAFHGKGAFGPQTTVVLFMQKKLPYAFLKKQTKTSEYISIECQTQANYKPTIYKLPI